MFVCVSPSEALRGWNITQPGVAFTTQKQSGFLWAIYIPHVRLMRIQDYFQTDLNLPMDGARNQSENQR